LRAGGAFGATNWGNAGFSGNLGYKNFIFRFEGVARMMIQMRARETVGYFELRRRYNHAVEMMPTIEAGKLFETLPHRAGGGGMF
jgi:hypothetical protein